MNRLATCLLVFLVVSAAAEARELRVLFLGDNGHHQPRARFVQLEPVMRGKGIKLDYTDNVADLNAATLADYDAVALYANIDSIEGAQADALLEYVASGKGFIPIHCATYCFRNDERIVALMGHIPAKSQQFRRRTDASGYRTVCRSQRPRTLA